ncbi:MAG: LuxR C-terminal-related transcriptional regulator [Candidatus Krumholzibacteriota bacterium]
METNRNPYHFLDNLEVGITITTWHPEDTSLTDWIFVNEKRCRLTGHTREELFKQPPVGQLTRESKAQLDRMNEVLAEQGHFTCESTLRHRSNTAIPVGLHLKLIPNDGHTLLLVEQHDISSFKETESLLKLSRESAGEMLTLIDKEKQKISANIEDNLKLVLYPLIDQMRITATDNQREVLDIMVNRIGHIARQVGVVEPSGSFELNLTKRQILICEMIRDGMTSKEIALALDCSPSTINNHRNIIRRKLKLSGSSTNLQAFLNNPVGGNS